MKRLHLLPAFLALVIGTPASAQHVWLDVNGDGQCTAEDVLSPSVTRVDVWVDTDSNLDGSEAVCASGDGELTIHSYSFIFTAPSGGITYQGWADFMHYSNLTAIGVDGNDSWFGKSSATDSPPGTYKVGQLLIAVVGSPTLAIAATTPYEATAVTGFGSQCSGSNADKFMQYGTEFSDACGTASPTSVTGTTWGKIKMLYR